jgi:excalibur calcium-binding domain-containing protein
VRAAASRSAGEVFREKWAVRARDKTSATPVTNFRLSTRIYRLAMSHDRGLDRDKDGIACEKA